MARRIGGTTVVVTGASSRIGRATALLFAARGANVILAARREDLFARTCEAAGSRALAVPTEVTDRDAMIRLAEAAAARFGRIGTWVDVAGTGVLGRYEAADLALHRRTVELNLIGPMNAAAAAAERGRR